MRKRVLAVAEVKKRIKDAKDALGVKTFKYNPQKGLLATELRAVCLTEGVDEILRRSSRNPRGFPMDRGVELIVDIVDVVTPTSDIRKVCIDVREIIMSTIYPVTIDGNVDPTTFLSELRIEGPFGYGLPDVEGIRLILSLNYIDPGIY